MIQGEIQDHGITFESRPTLTAPILQMKQIGQGNVLMD